MASSSSKKAQYMQEKLNPVLEGVVVEMLRKQPTDPKRFMLEWIKANKPSTLAARAAAEAAAVPEAAATLAPAEQPKAPEAHADVAAARSSLKSIEADSLGLALRVAIDEHVDYVDCKTGQRVIGGIDQKVVHGHSAEHEIDSKRRTSEHEAEAAGGSGLAHTIVDAARRMAVEVADERPDVLHSKWQGPVREGAHRAPLLELLGQAGEAAELAAKVVAFVEEARVVFAAGPTVNRAASPAKIFGDLHGHFRDLLMFLHHYGFPTTHGPDFVFNGDWVDRGEHQLETILLIYALKVVYPQKVFLNRGNHEDVVINNHMGHSGFNKDCEKKLGPADGRKVFHAFAGSFEYLPLATVVGEKILVLHGGIGDGKWDVSHLERVSRPVSSSSLTHDLVVYNALWSDPIDEDQRHSFGVHDSPRDGHANIIKQFGKDVTEGFLERNNLQMVVRSHECEMGGDGYTVMHDARLCRVFSARDYEDERNDGSILAVYQCVERQCMCVRAQQLQSVKKHHHSHHKHA